MNNTNLSEVLKVLRTLDSCAVANAIEQLNVRLRNEGYTDQTIQCQTPDLPSAVGFAATLRIRTIAPALDKKNYTDRTDWWDYLLSLPKPRMLVVEEIDPQPKSGAFLGEVHARIFAALGCVGLITNGVVRDIGKLAAMKFSAFSSGTTVSHAYMHIVEYDCSVTVGGLIINSGDLLHGDRNGIVSVPKKVAPLIPAISEAQLRHERGIIDFCTSPDFSVDGLRALLNR